MSRILYGPGDWLGSRLTARQRRAVAMWVFLVYVGTLPLRLQFKNAVWMVWILSELAIMISLLTIVAAETPVEPE